MFYRTYRICSGSYEVWPRKRGDRRFVRVVRVEYPNDGVYWIADPSFSSNTSDPLPTKRDAVRSAEYMLDNY